MKHIYFFYAEDNPHARLLMEKLAQPQVVPGSLIPLTREEMEVLNDPKQFHVLSFEAEEKERK